MNIQDYRESKINKYPDRQTGLLMYKHEKLFDIVSTIEEFVNLSIDGEPSSEEYKSFLEDLMIQLPNEYQDSTKDKFTKYISNYNKTLKVVNESKNMIFNMLSKLFGDNSKIERYGGSVVKILSPIKSESFKYEGMFTKNLLHQERIILPHKYQQSVKEHEFIHFLNKIGLLNGTGYFEKKEKNNEDITNRCKDEFIAQIQNNQDFNDICDMIVCIYMPYYLSKKYKKKIKYQGGMIRINKDGFYVGIGGLYNDNKTKDKIDFFKEHENIKDNKKDLYRTIYKDMMRLAELIKGMSQKAKEIYNNICPQYYSKKQYSYLLAFTPLSQRQSLLDYYKKLNSLDQPKTDLHSTLSETHDQSPL